MTRGWNGSRRVLAIAAILFAASIRADAPDSTSASEDRIQRRAKVLAALGKAPGQGGVLLLRAPRAPPFHEFDSSRKADPNLYYLSGIDEEGVALLLSAREIEGLGREILFLPPRSRMEGLWIAPRLTPQAALRRSGIPESAILQIEKLPEVLRKAVRAARGAGEGGKVRLCIDTGGSAGPGEPLPEGYSFLLATLGAAAFHLDLAPPAELIAPLRQVKSPGEILLLRRAIEITCRAQRKAMRAARPGATEGQLAALIDFEFRSRGARGPSFAPIVGSGPNACILHHDRYGRTVAAGDLVLLDIGADHERYAADVTRTVPASGRFTERQRRLYRIVYEAQETALRSIRPGVSLEEVIQVATDGVADGLIGMGLIRQRSEVRKYLPHRTSHGIGLDVHDAIVGKLQAGMVITVEPGIYIPEESLGIRLEDDALVTETGFELLSGGAPRSPEDVERWLCERAF